MKKLVVISITNLIVICIQSQNKFKDGLKLYLNNDSTHFVKLTFINQTWLRWNDNNPGSTVYGTPQSKTFDIGLRRTRMQLFGLITDRIFVYTQFGMNNFNYLSARKTGAFFHDVTCDYALSPKHLWMGAGLTAWSGLSRFASPAVASIMTLDAPLFEQETNDATDQFLRKLSLYAKGKLGDMDYRLALTKPMVIQTSTLYSPSITKHSDFSTKPPEMQYQTYLMYQFFDKESNQLPYMTGTYLGKKKVFNIGMGLIYQDKAMWRLNGTDTVYEAMQLLAVDIFYDAPLNIEKGSAISLYMGYFNSTFGKDYIRAISPMAPTNGINANSSFNGTGAAFPGIGSGQTVYTQIGYLLPLRFFKSGAKLMPFADFTFSQFKRLKDPVLVYEAGCNLFFNEHSSKLSLNYQSRPIFNTDSAGDIRETKSARRGNVIIQYQIAI